jgi:hypothetical protein
MSISDSPREMIEPGAGEGRYMCAFMSGYGNGQYEVRWVGMAVMVICRSSQSNLNDLAQKERV